MLTINYLRPIVSTAELGLQAQIAGLLQSNYMVQNPLALSFDLRPMCAPRWAVEYREGKLWFYRNCEKLQDRTPLAVLKLAPRPG